MTSAHSNHPDHKKSYGVVLISLVILTIITVVVAYQNFGILNIVIAMGVATIKGALVCLYFMHLRYDNRVNQVVFISAFLFLAIFISLTASDSLFRPVELAIKVNPVQAGGDPSAQIKQFLQSTPELIKTGEALFMNNCQACHGASGKGDGPAAAALNPKPRDFTSGYWKQGGSPAQVFKTIGEGIKGSPMPGFSTLSIKERFALAHYIRSLSSNTPPDSPETLAAIGLKEGNTNSAPQALPEIPVDFVIDRMIKEKQQ